MDGVPTAGWQKGGGAGEGVQLCNRPTFVLVCR